LWAKAFPKSVPFLPLLPSLPRAIRCFTKRFLEKWVYLIGNLKSSVWETASLGCASIWRGLKVFPTRMPVVWMSRQVLEVYGRWEVGMHFGLLISLRQDPYQVFYIIIENIMGIRRLDWLCYKPFHCP